MAISDPKAVQIRELRFKPANSNDRARAGLEHAFKDVPPCSFAKDDGISLYIGSDSTIEGYPQTPANHEIVHKNVPAVAQEVQEASATLAHKLLRSGFAFSVFAHVAAALAVGYLTISLPDEALLEGESVIAIEFFSDNDSDVTTRTAQAEQDGEITDKQVVEEKLEEPVVEPVEKPVEQPKIEEKVVEEPAKPIEPIKQPDLLKEPQKAEEPVAGIDVPDVLTTTEPSSFQVEAAAKQILETTPIEPLPQMLPTELTAPVAAEIKPALAPVKSLPHPVSKPRVIEKIAKAKPIEKLVAKRPQPKPVEKETQKTPHKKPVKKKVARQDGNSNANNDKGSSQARDKGDSSREASQGNSKNRLKGNASVTNYKGQVERKIDRAKGRVSAGARGTAVVGFTIMANGSVSNLRIRKSSGKPAVDKAALEIIRKASPFPPIPADLGKKSFGASKVIQFNK